MTMKISPLRSQLLEHGGGLERDLLLIAVMKSNDQDREDCIVTAFLGYLIDG